MLYELLYKKCYLQKNVTTIYSYYSIFSIAFSPPSPSLLFFSPFVEVFHDITSSDVWSYESVDALS